MADGPIDERGAPVSTSWRTSTPEAVQPIADRVVLRITRDDYDALRDHLIRWDEREYAAYIVAGTRTYEDDNESVFEYLVRDIECIPPFRYNHHTKGFVSLPHDVTRDMVDAAGSENPITDDSTVFVIHSHPWADSPQYSSQDNSAEPPQLASITGDREGPHGSLIVGSNENSITGRVWPDDARAIDEQGPPAATPLDEIAVVGPYTQNQIIPTDSRLDRDDTAAKQMRDEMRDRQALLHDQSGNRDLGNADVVVVGAGGLGSLVVKQLAHIGIGRYGGALTIIDPDVVEESNRSRITGAEPDDVAIPSAVPDEDAIVPAQWTDEIENLGTAKVDVLERYIRSVDPRITVQTVPEVAQSKAGMAAITTADIVVSAVDRQLPRRIVSKACQQYLRPLVDAGVAIDTDGSISIVSRVSTSIGSQPCLDCRGVINEDRLQREQHGEDIEAYGLEGDQPAVMTVNEDAAQRAAFIVHRYVTGLLAENKAPFNTGTFDLTTNDMAPDSDNRDAECPYCGSKAVFRARGDRAPTPQKDLTRRRPAAIRDQSPRVVDEQQSFLDRVRDVLSGLP